MTVNKAIRAQKGPTLRVVKVSTNDRLAAKRAAVQVLDTDKENESSLFLGEVSETDIAPLGSA